MLASITKTPELILDESEAKAIAEATAKVSELYDLSADPKTIAWCNLAMVCGTVYGTRFIAIRSRKKERKETVRKDKIVPINGGQFVPPTLPDWDTGPVDPNRTKQ